MTVGIERLSLYPGRLAVDIAAIARRRGKDVRYVTDEVMAARRTVVPPWEDVVTLAVNAVAGLPSGALDGVALLVVATESAVDFGKPVSTWVHRFAGLDPRCRSFEIKHACYSATAGLRMAAAWVAQTRGRALLVSADLTRPTVTGSEYDFLGGGSAVAAVIGPDPAVFAVDPERAGYWTTEIADIFRPSARDEVGDPQTSLYAYLDALDGAFDHYEHVTGGVDYEGRFAKHVYHAPFPGMTLQAHRSVLSRFGRTKAEARRSFDEKVAGGLGFARELGSAYGASNLVCLAGLLHEGRDLGPGDRISLFSYGSGCQGELYEGTVGPEGIASVRAQGIDRAIASRVELDVEGFAANEAARGAGIDTAAFRPGRGAGWEAYEGRRLLVLDGVDGWRRSYGWAG